MTTHLCHQMQWRSVMLILVKVWAPSTEIMFTALAVRPTSLTAPMAQISRVPLAMQMMLEYDVKV